MAYWLPFQGLETWRIRLQTDDLPPHTQRVEGGRYVANAFLDDKAGDDGARGGEVWQRNTFPGDIRIVAAGVLSSNHPAWLARETGDVAVHILESGMAASGGIHINMTGSIRL